MNPAIRSGPSFLIVYKICAAIISVTSLQFALTLPPFPRASLYALALFSSSTIEAHAAIRLPLFSSNA